MFWILDKWSQIKQVAQLCWKSSPVVVSPALQCPGVISFGLLADTWGWNWCLLTSESSAKELPQKCLLVGNVGPMREVFGVLSVISNTVSCSAWSKLDSNYIKVITVYILWTQHTDNRTRLKKNIICSGVISTLILAILLKKITCTVGTCSLDYVDVYLSQCISINI